MVFKNMVNIMLIYLTLFFYQTPFKINNPTITRNFRTPTAGPFILELQITLQPDKLLTSLLLPKNHT